MNIAFITYGDYHNWTEGSTHNYAVISRLTKFDFINKVYLFGFGTDSLKQDKLASINLNYFKNLPFKAVQASPIVFSNLLLLILQKKIDLIYERDSLHCFGIGARTGKLFGIPVISEVNGDIIEELKSCGVKNRILHDYVNKRRIRNLDISKTVIVVSNGLKSIIRNLGIEESKIHVMYNGTDTDIFSPVPKEAALKKTNLPNKPRICFVGGFVKWQGLSYILKAFSKVLKKMPECQLVLVGDGPERASIFDMIKKLGIEDNVTITGNIPQLKVPDFINSSDVCVVFRTEGFKRNLEVSPLKLCEYMSCEKPVVCNKISGFEFLEQNNCGISVNPKNASSVSDVFVKLLKNGALRGRMGKNGRNFVIEHRTWDSVAQKTADLIKEAVTQK